MMTNFMFSVAMTTYNGARYLEEQLKSIAEQSRKPNELVVCDDRSSDSTVELLENFAQQAGFPVRIFRNDVRLGSNKNFEKTIGLCTGDIIVLADQDDVWHKEKLNKLEAEFHDPEVGLVFSDADLVDEQLVPLGTRLWHVYNFDAKAQKKFKANEAYKVLLNRTVVTGATMAFRTKFREAALPFPEATPTKWWIHDAWIAMTVASMARLAFIPEPLILYRQHGNNQIGARVMSFQDKVAILCMKDKPSFYLLEYQEAHSHLKRLYEQGHKLHQGLLDYAEEKQLHLENRAAISGTLVKRLSLIYQETKNRRYFRFSSGWKSVIRDIFFS